MLLGTYEPRSTPWKVDGTPLDFGHELAAAGSGTHRRPAGTGFERIPALANAGIKDASTAPSPSALTATR